MEHDLLARSRAAISRVRQQLEMVALGAAVPCCLCFAKPFLGTKLTGAFSDASTAGGLGVASARTTRSARTTLGLSLTSVVGASSFFSASGVGSRTEVASKYTLSIPQGPRQFLELLMVVLEYFIL